MTYICYQGNDQDCGFAALRMLMANVSRNKSYLYVQKPQKRKNYTYYDLIRYARRYGFSLNAYRLPIGDYMKIPKNSILLLRSHLVYVKKIHKHYVTVYDPYYGKDRISIAEFKTLWNGTLITCVCDKHIVEIDYKKPRFVPLWMDIVHYALVTVVFGSLLVGFYLIKDDSSIVVTMIFLLLFGVAELVENWYIIKELNFFDNTFMPKFFSLKKHHNYKHYSFYVEYKTKYFATGKTLISNLVVILAFGTLLCVNDYRNLFVILILLLMKLLDNRLFSKIEKNGVRQIENIEAVAFDVDLMVVRNLSKANKLAGHVSLSTSVKKILYSFVCLCMALMMMISSGIVSSNFVIFHFGIYFIASEAFEHLISYFSTSKERQLKRARFLDACDL